MKSIFEIAYRYLIPAIRREIVKMLIRRGFMEVEIARLLNISHSLVSRYLSGERGYKIDLSRYRDVMEKYLDWSNGKTKKKILIVYVSMWGYTHEIVKLIENEILSQDIDIVIHDIASTDVGDIAKDLADSSAVIIATPTVLGFAHPLIIQIVYLLKVLKPPIKYGGVIVTYAWGSKADQQLIDMLRDTGIELIDVIKINVALTNNDVIRIKEFIDRFIKKIV